MGLKRDPARIPDVLRAVEDAWRENPDLRLGQLITYAARQGGTTPFFMEDANLIRTLEADMPKKDKQPKEESPPAFTLEGWLQLAEREVLPRLRKLFDR